MVISLKKVKRFLFPKRTPIKTLSGKLLFVSSSHMPTWKPRRKRDNTPQFNLRVEKTRAKNKVAKKSRKTNR